jgi:hypothetical protein
MGLLPFTDVKILMMKNKFASLKNCRFISVKNMVFFTENIRAPGGIEAAGVRGL